MVLDVLENVIKYARKIQKPYDEDDRIKYIQGWKKKGYIASDSSEDSPIDKNYYEKSMSVENRKRHEKLRKIASGAE